MSSFRSSEAIYDRLLFYRYYRLGDVNQGVSAAEMIKVRTHIKRLDIMLKEHNFDGTDPIMVFQFLIHIITEDDKMSMFEGLENLALPTYL